MYGLKEAAILACEQLQVPSAKYGYVPVKYTPVICRLFITFTLSVDDFGIKYLNKDDSNHLFSALQDKYNITIE